MNTEQLRADFEAWYEQEYSEPIPSEFTSQGFYPDVRVQLLFRCYQAGRAALQSQDREDATRIDWMARQDLDDLCFSIIRDAPHDGEYCVDAGRGPVFGGTFREAIDRARRIEGEGR